jgi:polysaccharide export outer membrane protein
MVLTWMLFCIPAGAEEANNSVAYRVQPGDVLSISVWREEGLQLESVLVRPDGAISIPLAGEIQTSGKTIEDLRREITERMRSFIPDLSVMVSAKQLFGNKIYVIGKVARPGEFVLTRSVDVMQALSMAGGTDRFANLGDIKILRRENGGAERAIPFDYTLVQKGKGLEQNILLEVGDVVVVP